MPIISPPVGPAGATFNGGTITPAAGGNGLDVAPVNPNGTASNTTGVAVEVPQSAAPNFPNIYALRVVDPDTAAVPFYVGSDGSTVIDCQPGSIGLKITAASVNPDTRTFEVLDTTSTEAFRIDKDGGVTVFQDVGFYGTAPIAQQTGVPVNVAGIHAALVNLGLITA